MKIRKIFNPQEKHPIKIAVYCRIATRYEGQENSYVNISTLYKHKLGQKLTAIYADTGLSGAHLELRPQFLEMIRDGEAGLYDVLMCKSLRVFSHDLRDAVLQIRKLRKRGIRIIFESENFDTNKDFTELVLQVLNSFGEEAGEFEGGILAPVFGYRKVDGNYEINPEEAEVVKKVFWLYEHGLPVCQIIDVLGRRNYPADESKIYYIIQNEKYVGDFILRKYIPADYSSHNMILNEGQVPSMVIANHHEAIISREQFDRCNVIFDMRKKRTYSFYPFGFLLKCPYCGHSLAQRNLPLFNGATHFLCEGERACRQFAILAAPTRKNILRAWNELPSFSIFSENMQAGAEQEIWPEELKLLRREKAQHPSFEELNYWWLDKYILRITFGAHTKPEDCTIRIFWKCGLITVLPSGVDRPSKNPPYRAYLWNRYVLQHANQYPDLASEIIASVHVRRSTQPPRSNEQQ